MAESTGFQHITVVPADDEIVIRAGARAVESELAVNESGWQTDEAEPDSSAGNLPVAESAAFEEEPVFVEEDPDAKAEAQLEHLESSSGNFSRALHEAIAEERRGKPAKEAWRETTLEDLEGAPMSGMQKVILFALLGILVLFVVYCALHFGAHLL